VTGPDPRYSKPEACKGVCRAAGPRPSPARVTWRSTRDRAWDRWGSRGQGIEILNICWNRAATAGTIMFHGEALEQEAGADGAVSPRGAGGIPGPQDVLDPRMRVGSIVAKPLRSLRIPGDHACRCVTCSPRWDWTRRLSRYPSEFSGGQRQRIAIAGPCALPPRIDCG